MVGGSADKRQRRNMNLDMEDNWMTHHNNDPSEMMEEEKEDDK